jgi:hypothetical protein
MIVCYFDSVIREYRQKNPALKVYYPQWHEFSHAVAKTQQSVADDTGFGLDTAAFAQPIAVQFRESLPAPTKVNRDVRNHSEFAREYHAF